MPASKQSEQSERRGDDLTIETAPPESPSDNTLYVIPAPKEQLPAVVEPLEGEIVAPETDRTTPAVFQKCGAHPTVSYRIGGFCEKCYSEDSMMRMKQIDDALAEEVISKMQTHVQQLLESNDDAVIERFIGRVMKRFERPARSEVAHTLKAVHLHAPVDFGPGG